RPCSRRAQNSPVLAPTGSRPRRHGTPPRLTRAGHSREIVLPVPPAGAARAATRLRTGLLRGGAGRCRRTEAGGVRDGEVPRVGLRGTETRTTRPSVIRGVLPRVTPSPS